MYHTLVGAMLLLATLVGVTGIRAMRAQWQRARSEPSLTLRDGPAAVLLLLRLLLAGGTFGFSLAMLLDRWLGNWGIVLAAVLCTAVCVVLYLRLPPKVHEEST